MNEIFLVMVSCSSSRRSHFHSTCITGCLVVKCMSVYVVGVEYVGLYEFFYCLYSVH